jgi:hypothetical protein
LTTTVSNPPFFRSFDVLKPPIVHLSTSRFNSSSSRIDPRHRTPQEPRPLDVLYETYRNGIDRVQWVLKLSGYGQIAAPSRWRDTPPCRGSRPSWCCAHYLDTLIEFILLGIARARWVSIHPFSMPYPDLPQAKPSPLSPIMA